MPKEYTFESFVTEPPGFLPRLRVRFHETEFAQSARWKSEQLDEIGYWCTDNGIGSRQSYDTFAFRNEKDLTLFLLKWG